MKKRPSMLPVSFVAILLCYGAVARAQTPVAAPASGIPGWDEFVDGLKVLPGQMLDKLPPAERADPQVREEVGRLMLEAVASSALTALNGDGDHPAFVALFNQTLNLARPNADTVYRTAEITPGGTYRLRGRRGTLRIVEIGEAGSKPPPISVFQNGSAPTADLKGRYKTLYHDLNALHVDRNGRYDVILSPERPAGYKGDWWQLAPTSARLMLRMVGDDWRKEEDPTFSIERLDRPITRPRPSAAELEQRLRTLPAAIPFNAGIRMGYMSELRQEGYINKLKVEDISQVGGLIGQSYYEGAYDLNDDEALIVEAKEPDKCLYRSIILTNDTGETVDWTNNESSLNDSQAKPDKDGVLRIVVAAKDPGVPNWLDTAGYLQGAIQGRWTNCTAQPIPSMRKVALSDVRKVLPPETPIVTPAAREHLIRDRREAYQQRAFW